MEMRNIALYHPWIKSKGGAERVLFEYAKHSKHNVSLLTHYKEETFQNYDIPVTVLGNEKLDKNIFYRGGKTAAKLLTKRIPTEQYDGLIVSEAGIGCLATLRNNSLPLLCYCHTILRPAHHFYFDYIRNMSLGKKTLFRTGVSIYRALERWAWKRFDSIICNSQNTLSHLNAANLGRGIKKKIINPGVNPEKFNDQIIAKGDYFFYPSRFKEYKRQDLAIKAFLNFKQQEDSKTKLILAGYPDDKEYYQKLYKKYSNNQDILFKPNVSDAEMNKLYANCLAALFTAKDEDWGIVPLEAMAAQKPVIAVQEGGPREIVADQKNGYLAKANPQKLAEKMQLLLTDEKQYDKLSAEAEHTARNYSWENFAKNLDHEVEYIL